MTFPLRWGIEPLNGPPFTGLSIPAQTTPSTSTIQQVICLQILVYQRHMEVHAVLDIYNIRGGIPGSRIMGMECLLFQNEMGCTDSCHLCVIRRIYCSR